MKSTGTIFLWITIIAANSGITAAMDQNEAIKIYDKNGTEYLIPRGSYRTDILPGVFEKAWNDDEALYSAIVTALDDKFYLDTLKPALRYQEISNDPESSSVLLGITYMQLNRLKEARGAFQEYLEKYGDSGIVLTNLAKVVAEEGDKDRSLQYLWKSLKADPNQDNALDWWSAIHYEKGGVGGRIDSIEKVANLPGSWRPQLWLARNHMELGEKEKALIIYQTILSTDAASRGDVLMMVSGDLGNNKLLEDAVRLVAPIYKPKVHGIEAGVNLVMVYKQLGMKKQGLALVNRLEALERYDWIEQVSQLKHDLSSL